MICPEQVAKHQTAQAREGARELMQDGGPHTDTIHIPSAGQVTEYQMKVAEMTVAMLPGKWVFAEVLESARFPRMVFKRVLG